MKSYNHFTLEERECLQKLLELSVSLRKIAKTLNRNVSTISRELKRNRNKDGSYHPWASTVKYICRRKLSKKHYRLEVDTNLISWTKECMNKFWSPEIIVAKWKENNNYNPLSHSTIYRAIKFKLLPEYTPKTHFRRRGKRINNSNSIFNTIQPEHTIHDRPQEINERHRVGDWEGDTVCGAINKGYLVTFIDRKSRYLAASKSNRKVNSDINQAIYKALKGHDVKTITFDNGSEFGGFREIESTLNSTVYFADPHSPWQRGSNENINGLLRFFFPKGTDFTKVTDECLQYVITLINERPRKCLGWLSPKDFLNKCCI